MNKQLQQLASFLKKNRTFIYIILGVALLMQLLSGNVFNSPSSESVTQIESVISNAEDVQTNHPAPTDNQGMNHFLWMIILVLLFFVAKRRGWLDKLFPSLVLVRLSLAKQKSTGHLVAKVVLINHKKEAISFDNPTVNFHHGKELRTFVIKNIGGVNYFPITLAPRTGHNFNIDVDKFYNNVEGLKKFKKVSVHFATPSGKVYKSTKTPVWLVFKHIK